MFSTKLRLMIGGGLLVLAAVVLLFSSMGSWLHTRAFLKKAVKVNGFIIRIVDGEKPNVHYPIYGFRDPSISIWREVYSDVGTHPAPPTARRGDRVPLLYLPDDPGHGIRITFWNLWALPVKQCAFGLLALLAGGGVLYAARAY